MPTSKRTGKCLCGAVTVVAHDASDEVGACHCGTCRRWGGGPFMEIDCGSSVVWTGEEAIGVFQSSEWAERGFCNRCGTHLFYRIKETSQHMVPIGLFGDDDTLVFDRQVFIDEKPAFYSFTETTTNLTGAEIFAMFGPDE